MSRQSLGIARKIREVDKLLRTNASAKRIIREVHPEILFWSLNGRTSMKHRKTSREGFEERLNLLRRYLPGSESIVNRALIEYRRKEVGRDDVVDALAAAITGKLTSGSPASIPETPERDSFGLLMEMVYYAGAVRKGLKGRVN